MSDQQNKKIEIPSKFSKDELSLIKSTFNGNDLLLRALRNRLLQFPLTAADLSVFQLNLKGKDIENILYKQYISLVNADFPIGMSSDDMWTSAKIVGLPKEEAILIVKGMDLVIKYLDQQLKNLHGGLTDGISLEKMIECDGKDDAQLYVDIIARNTIISHVDRLTYHLKTLSELKDEEEVKEDDSAK